MRVRYAGPSVGVDLLGPNGETIRVARGESIDVPDDYGAALVMQADWSSGDDDANDVNILKAAIPGLSHQAAVALVGAGYREPADLASARDDDLRAIKGVGDASFDAIRASVPVNGDD